MMNLFFWITFIAISALLFYNKWFREVEYKREAVALASVQVTVKKEVRNVSTGVPKRNQEPVFSFYTIQPEIQAVPLARNAKNRLDLIPITQNADTKIPAVALQQVA